MADPISAKDVSIFLRDDVSILHIAARRGSQRKVELRAGSIFGANLPSLPRIVEAQGVTIVWAGPAQWLIVRGRTVGAQDMVDLNEAFGRLASIVEVGDSRVLINISGVSAREFLSKCIPVDLHEREFKPGIVAITHCNHLGVTLWRTSDGNSYELLCARTYAEDFLRHWYCTASAPSFNN